MRHSVRVPSSVLISSTRVRRLPTRGGASIRSRGNGRIGALHEYEETAQMPNTQRSPNHKSREYRLDSDEDDTLREVGEDHDFEIDEELDPADRRRDPLRQPH